jgi:phosphoserine phosphatase
MVRGKNASDHNLNRRIRMRLRLATATAALIFTTTAWAGGLIEASFARKQRRGASPQYASDAIRERISDLSGLNPDVLQSLSDDTLRPGVPAMLTGLQGAGMR